MIWGGAIVGGIALLTLLWPLAVSSQRLSEAVGAILPSNITFDPYGQEETHTEGCSTSGTVEAPCLEEMLQLELPARRQDVQLAGEVNNETYAKETPQGTQTQSSEREEEKNRITAKIIDEANRSNATVADVELLLCIAEKESGFNPRARNSTSSASGVFQFIRSTFNWVSAELGEDWTHAEDVLDEDKNIRAGVYLYMNYGPTHWEVYNLGWCS